MIVLRNKLFSSIGNKAKIGLGVAGAIGGYKLLKSSNDDGKLTGTVNLYHGTLAKNKKNILEQGLKRNKDTGKLVESIYNKKYLGKKDKNIYLAKKRSISDEVNAARYASIHKINPLFIDSDKVDKENTILNIKMSRGDYKKLKTADNPELLGAKNKNEFRKNYYEKNPIKKGSEEDNIVSSVIRRKILNGFYKDMTKNTVSLDQELDPKYIEGSKKYIEPNKWKNFKKHAKEDKKELLGSIGKAALGTGLLAGGGLLIRKGLKL